MIEQNNFIILTGGPGAGKTTLLQSFVRDGYGATEEAGRAIIRHQVDIGGPALPWRDPPLFAELMLCWEMRNYEQAKSRDGLVFFDRGLPDIVGYLRLSGLAVPAHLMEAARRYRYRRPVFILPPWPEIYRQDEERRQDLDEARRTFEAMAAVYSEFDYALYKVPKAPIEARKRFILERLDGNPA